LDGYRAALRPALEAVFQGAAGRDLTLEQVEGVRRQARELFVKLLGPYEIISKDPVFSPDVSARDVLPALAALVATPILVALADRASILTNDFVDATADVKARLTALSSSAVVDRLFNAARNDADLTRLLAEQTATTSLLGMDPVEIQSLSQGQENASAPDLGQAANIGQVDGFATRYRALLERVVDLRKLIRLIVRIDGPYQEKVSKLVKDKKLGQADLTAARAVIEEVGALENLVTSIGSAIAAVERIHRTFESVSVGLEALVARVELSVQNVAVVSSNTYGDFNTFYSDHTSADAGFLYAFGVDAVVPYLATNIYFRPVNRDAPLSLKGGWGRRLSLTIGLTVKSIEDAAGTRKDLFGSQAGVIGIGYRARETIRLMLGGLVFRKKEKSPLRGSTSLAVDPFLAMSFDVDVGKIPGVLGGVFK